MASGVFSDDLLFIVSAICGMLRTVLCVWKIELPHSTDLHRPPQGPERVNGLYAFRTLLDHGARLALGSDFPVEDMNPLCGFYAAVARLTPNGASPRGPSGW
jgi:predicted amidohydrolase YtcJ